MINARLNGFYLFRCQRQVLIFFPRFDDLLVVHLPQLVHTVTQDHEAFSNAHFGLVEIFCVHAGFPAHFFRAQPIFINQMLENRPHVDRVHRKKGRRAFYKPFIRDTGMPLGTALHEGKPDACLDALLAVKVHA